MQRPSSKWDNWGPALLAAPPSCPSPTFKHTYLPSSPFVDISCQHLLSNPVQLRQIDNITRHYVRPDLQTNKMTLPPKIDGLQIEVLREGSGDREVQRGTFMAHL